MVIISWVSFVLTLLVCSMRARRAVKMRAWCTAAAALKHSPGWSCREEGEEDAMCVDGGEECCVCLSRLMEGGSENGNVRVLPCLHRFHSDCIGRWLHACRKTCPVCRMLMEEDNVEELTEELLTWFSSFHVW